jgi:membrane fusion protein (multidrug efflux system)
MYVVFPVSVRAVLDLRKRYADKGGNDAVIVKLRLSDGSMYGKSGRLDYIDPSVATSTDTLTLRARIPNPLLPGSKIGDPGNRDLVDGEFVTVSLEGVEPVQALGIPRTAVLSDQQGNFVYVVGPDNKAEQRRIVLGQSTPDTAVILSGLKEGETVIADGLQRVRPGVAVNPAPLGQKPPGPGGPVAGAAPAKG